jgi:hypothetical protein
MGFLSVPACLHALAGTKRAFSGTWGHSLGIGPPPTIALAHKIRRQQALPAFRSCSIDNCPGDGRWGEDGDRDGYMNAFLMWEPETITDQPDEFAITTFLHEKAPEDSCTADLTPRRCQQFRPKPGQQFIWTSTSAADGEQVQSGTATADQWGLVTVSGLKFGSHRNRGRVVRQ